MNISPFSRRSMELAEADQVYDRKTHQLKNRFDIKDPKRLQKVEQLLFENRVAQLPKNTDFRSYEGFKKIHAHLFQDVFKWAGKERGYMTVRGQSPFAAPPFIEKSMNKVFQQLKDQKFLVGMDMAQFAKHAARHVNEINAVHPFPDGNGRTQRVWLQHLAKNAGYHVILKASDRRRWNEASRVGFEKLDHKPMADLIGQRLISKDRLRQKAKELNIAPIEATIALKPLKQMSEQNNREKSVSATQTEKQSHEMTQQRGGGSSLLGDLFNLGGLSSDLLTSGKGPAHTLERKTKVAARSQTGTLTVRKSTLEEHSPKRSLRRTRSRSR